MSHISELKLILSQQLNWHKSRIDFFARIILALFICRTVSLSELAIAMDSKANPESRNRRIRRFLANFIIDYDVIAKWLFGLFFAPDAKIYLAIDRTNWFFGKAKINIFMLCVCHEGIAIPLFWTLLPKAGSSTANEQITLVNRFIKVFGTKNIQALLADREFPNNAFIAWLQLNKIPFYMRIKQNTLTHINGRQFKTCEQLFSHISAYQQEVFGMSLTVFNQLLFLAASKNERGELMIIVTNANPKIAIAAYLRRWEIETLFQALKGRGFKFENTHITNLERIEKLIVIMSVAFSWAHKIGEWRSKIKPILLKNKINQKRPQYSYFRYGLDFISDKLTGFKIITLKKFNELIEFIKPLSIIVKCVT